MTENTNVIRLFKLDFDQAILLQSTLLNHMLLLRQKRLDTTEDSVKEMYAKQINEIAELSINISEQIQRYFPNKNK